MTTLSTLKSAKKARIGLCSTGLNTYWQQFEGLCDCLMGYNAFIAARLGAFGEVVNYGVVDTETKKPSDEQLACSARRRCTGTRATAGITCGRTVTWMSAARIISGKGSAA